MSVLKNKFLNIAMLGIHSCPIGKLGTTDTGGMSVYIRELARSLGSAGHQVDIYTRLREEERPQVMRLSDHVRLIHLDVDLAYKVVTLDDEVDRIKVEAYDRIKAALAEHPDKVSYLVNLLLISRHLERLADHATNIAEEVIYLIEGEIVRHRQDS